MAVVSTPVIIALDAVRATDARLVGAKAMRLAELQKAGFPVPPGFCVTTVATARWDEAVRDQLRQACRQLGGRVSVRSSAVEEDRLGASYAGIYHSELPVEGEAQVLAAAERCLASWHAAEALAYRRLQGDTAAPVMALIVQRLVPATASGVAYTRDPLDRRNTDVHLNSTWGLGEPLAAGRISGDTLALSRRGRLLRQQVALKNSELTVVGSRKVPAARARAASLTLAQARRVALLALAAERHFGGPQDVEFAFDADRLWILQSRPLSGGASRDEEFEAFLEVARRRVSQRWRRLRERGVLRGRDMILSNGNIGELLPTPSAMSFGLFRQIFAGRYGAIAVGRRRLGYRFEPGLVEHLYELVGGQAYFDLEIDAATFDFGAAPLVDHYLSKVADDPSLANYPELGLYDGHVEEAGGESEVDSRMAVARLRHQEFHRAMSSAGRQWQARFVSGVPDEVVLSARPDWPALSVGQCAAQVSALIRFLRTGPCVVFVQVARLGFYFAARLRRQLLQLLGAEGEAHCARLLSGLPGSVVTQQALDLEALAAGRMCRDQFLRTYGHTAANELELSEPRLVERPRRLDEMLADLRHSGRAPGHEFARQQAERIGAEAALARRLQGAGVTAAAREALFADLRLAQALLPLRETVKHHYTAVHAEIRRGLLTMAERLGWPPERIFDLLPRELPAAARQPERMRRIADRRAGERQLARRAASEGRLPAVILASRVDRIGNVAEQASGDRWQGTALSPGRCGGIARVVDSDDALPRLSGSGNEILILRAANLGIAPLLRMVAGVIVEVGGLLAHSACQAREAGIPAIALPGATRLIPDGAEILIDGHVGQVALIHPAGQVKRDERHTATV